MHNILAVVIQVGLIFGPVLLLIALRWRITSKTVNLFIAVILALLTGWCASFLASTCGWQPVLKSGKTLDASPTALFWIIGGTGLLILMLVVFAKPAGRNSSQAGGGPVRGAGNKGWRVGHRGRDTMYYEEFREGAWHQIAIDGEMLTGRAHHVIYFASPDQWEKYPEWARGRRGEIIARIKSEFAQPDYEYYGG